MVLKQKLDRIRIFEYSSISIVSDNISAIHPAGTIEISKEFAFSTFFPSLDKIATRPSGKFIEAGNDSKLNSFPDFSL